MLLKIFYERKGWAHHHDAKIAQLNPELNPRTKPFGFLTISGSPSQNIVSLRIWKLDAPSSACPRLQCNRKSGSRQSFLGMSQPQTELEAMARFARTVAFGVPGQFVAALGASPSDPYKVPHSINPLFSCRYS